MKSIENYGKTIDNFLRKVIVLGRGEVKGDIRSLISQDF